MTPCPMAGTVSTLSLSRIQGSQLHLHHRTHETSSALTDGLHSSGCSSASAGSGSSGSVFEPQPQKGLKMFHRHHVTVLWCWYAAYTKQAKIGLYSPKSLIPILLIGLYMDVTPAALRTSNRVRNIRNIIMSLTYIKELDGGGKSRPVSKHLLIHQPAVRRNLGEHSPQGEVSNGLCKLHLCHGTVQNVCLLQSISHNKALQPL